MVVERVGDVGVGEGEGVGVLAEGGGCVAVTQAGLGLQDVPAGDEERGDVVAEMVQSRARYPGVVAQAREAVPERPGGEPLVVRTVGGEEPLPERSGRFALCPVRGEGVPEAGGGGAEGEREGPPRLRGRDRAGRFRSLDVQDAAVEVRELERGELAAAGAGVGGEAGEEQVLFAAACACAYSAERSSLARASRR